MVATYEYDAFGGLRAKTGTADTAFRFTGEQWDSESGFYYLRARYYDPAIGRFVSQDPFLGFVVAPQSLSRYPYVVNNPANLTDPAGLQCGLTRPWECGGIPIPIWPVPVDVPDIPLEFNPKPVENWKAWWNWITRSNKTQRAENPYHPMWQEGPPIPPQMPYPGGPGGFRLPNCNALPQPQQRAMCWGVWGMAALAALERTGVGDLLFGSKPKE